MVNNGIKLQNLDENKRWQELKSLWKRIKDIDFSDDLISKSIDAALEGKEGLFTPIDFKRKSIGCLKQLKKDGLIDHKTRNFIYKLIRDRLDHLEQEKTPNAPTCYMMMMEGMERKDSLENLEKRYSLLEKLYRRNKINSSTFEKVIEQIKIEIYIVELVDKSDPFNINSGLYELICDLRDLKVKPDLDDCIVNLVVELNK